MLRLHHVNLGVPVGGRDAELAFLDLLGYHPLDSSDGGPTATWFEDDAGTQIHLSEDPDHRPAARAHVAVELGDSLATIEARLDESGQEYSAAERFDRRIVFCQDPAGNRWELRGVAPG